MSEDSGGCVFVRLTKFGVPETPCNLTPSVAGAFKPGAPNPRWLLPLGYWLEGWLLAPPQVGRCVQVLRVNRNGVHRLGVFVSTPVVSLLEGWSFATANSLYHCVAAEPRGALTAEMLRSLIRAAYGRCHGTM